MMKRSAMLLLALFLFFTPAGGREPDRPALVVGIVVDQMRWDYLYRFYERYGEGGFKRLMREGYNCQNTRINYLPAFTGPGHATIYTGSVPALHGIVANDWIDTRTGKEWYCAGDTAVRSIGGGRAGRMSPRNMLATTIADELRLATNFRSRSIGISLKDRGAIFPAGHSANAAYWYDASNGHFISSSYYMEQLPGWLQEFNRAELADSLMARDWNTLHPIGTYIQSTVDDNPYEGRAPGEERPVFPHRGRGAGEGKDYGAIRYTPDGNTLLCLMAEACLEGESLGKKGHTDFLALSFSAADYIGHRYGPNAIELEDSYLRLDRELALLLQALDAQVGEGNYLVFLSSDHGGAHNARFLEDHRIPAGTFSISRLREELNSFLQERYGQGALVRSLINYQVYLDEEALLAKEISREAVRRDIIRWLGRQPGLTYVLDMEQPGSSRAAEPLATMVRNGYRPGRCGSIGIVPDPGWYSSNRATGATHGSWNPYDTRIPLLWYGWHIPKGASYREVRITDIAPTLAALLHIQEPNACTGKPIEALMP